MNSVLSISTAGMQGAMQRMQQAAHNVASLSVSPSDVGTARDPGAGLMQQGVSMLGELMAARVAANVVAANAALIRHWDEALGSLLDVHA